MYGALRNHHLFTPGNTRRIREIGFQFQSTGSSGNEIQGYWLKEGSSVRVERIRRDNRLLWQVSITNYPWAILHPDEDEVISTLEFLVDSPQVERMTKIDPLAF